MVALGPAVMTVCVSLPRGAGIIMGHFYFTSKEEKERKKKRDLLLLKEDMGEAER